LKPPIYINRDWHDYEAFYHPNPKPVQIPTQNTENPGHATAANIRLDNHPTLRISARLSICGVARSLAIRRWMFEDT
jgi:hypothetical protein